jgi:spore germination protein KA
MKRIKKGIYQKQILSQKNDSLFQCLSENVQKIKEGLGNSNDLLIRQIEVGNGIKRSVAIIFTKGLVDTMTIEGKIIEPLMFEAREIVWGEEDTEEEILDQLKGYIPTSTLKEIANFQDVFTAVLSGQTIILIDGSAKALGASTEGWESRNVDDPTTQSVVRGPKEAFNENLRTNTVLIRRKIKSHDLWTEKFEIGTETKTLVEIMYLKGVANDKVVQEVRDRLNRINVDGVFESGQIEEFIQDETFTPFPTILSSERPDTIAAGILEGRVAIVVDGTPFVLLVPALFVQFLQSPEDYYQRSDFGLIRFLRYLAALIGLLAPSFYIAVTTFHQEMLPSTLLLSIAAQREGVPLPAFAEALLMEISFEFLREAGVRMPRTVGQAVSIVGALVIGQAAVEAGIVSGVMVIIVSITAIANFILPNFNMSIAIRILRFIFMVFAASFGIFGIVVCFIALLLHLCSLRSFGVPYMSPLGPFILDDQKDTILRFPIWKMKKRPRLISQINNERETTAGPHPEGRESS